MALIVNNKVFIHIYKNGGNSIREILGKGQEIGSPHANIKQVKQLLQVNNIDSFTFVRNPYYHAVSTYNYIRIAKGHEFYNWCNKHSFEQWLVYMSGTLFKKPYNPKKDMYQIQSDFIDANTVVYKYEDFDNESNKMLVSLGMKPIKKAPKINVHGSEQRYSKLLTTQAKELIASIFKQDFESFGYETA